jgi:hypothetical protein
VDKAFADDLRLHLARFFARSMTLEQFRHWFSRAWWEAESSAPESLFDFATTIEHLTYILDDGVWDEGEFRRQLLTESTHFYGALDIQQTGAVPSIQTHA